MSPLWRFLSRQVVSCPAKAVFAEFPDHSLCAVHGTHCASRKQPCLFVGCGSPRLPRLPRTKPQHARRLFRFLDTDNSPGPQATPRDSRTLNPVAVGWAWVTVATDSGGAGVECHYPEGCRVAPACPSPSAGHCTLLSFSLLPSLPHPTPHLHGQSCLHKDKHLTAMGPEGMCKDLISK